MCVAFLNQNTCIFFFVHLLLFMSRLAVALLDQRPLLVTPLLVDFTVADKDNWRHWSFYYDNISAEDVNLFLLKMYKSLILIVSFSG